MLTKPQFFYDHTTRQALGFQNPFYLKKAQQLEPKLYDGNFIKNMSAIVIPDSEKTLMLADKSRSKMLLKQMDPMMLEKKVNTTPVDYANSVNSPDPTLSSRPTKVEVPKELPKVSMVNTSLKKLKHHLAGFDVVVKERTTTTTITEGSWGFEHTKACFRDKIIPFVKALKDLFNTFDQYLIDELSKVGNVFHQMEQAMEQHRLESKTFKVKMNKVLNENERLLEQVISKDIVNIIVNSSMDNASVNVHECEKCLKLETELLNKKDFIEKEIYDKLIQKKMLKNDVEPITPKLLNKKTAHSAYMKHTQEEAAVLRDLVEHVKANYPLDHSLESACRKHNQKIASSSNLVSNKPMLSSTGVKPSTSASGSQPSGNTKKDKIQQTPSSTQKNKVEAHPRTVKSSLKNKNSVVEPKGTANVQHSKLNANSELLCVKCNGCMLSDNHDLCVLDFINDVNARAKSKSVKKSSKRKVWKPTGKVFTNIGYTWRPTGRTFTIVGNACPLTRITTTAEVPLRKPTALESDTPKPVVTLVYSRKPRKSKTNVPVVQIVLWYLDSGCSKHMTGDRSQLTNFVNKFLGTVKFRNDHVAKILGYVAFHQHTYFIRNLEGVDLLTGSRGNYLYTLSLGDMMASSPICLLSKASKTKSWLWHRRLSHLNFGAINHLARHGLVRGLPKLKFEKDHLCSAFAMGKSKKKPHKPKSEDTNQEKLYLLHMDLCGPMRVASVNGKKYILVIVNDYSRFTWVKCLRSKDKAPDFIIKFLKMIQGRLKVPVRRIRTDNGTEFVNQTLREYYEKVGISRETSVACSPQQNDVVERRNRTLIEFAHTMLIYAKVLLFLWAEAVATACYTQNRSIIHLRHG
ncbi:retrovirus-related pol polyprotein from transposon TNT 1-94 [Tanacetum coccineum]